jgi:hypothetical protein
MGMGTRTWRTGGLLRVSVSVLGLFGPLGPAGVAGLLMSGCASDPPSAVASVRATPPPAEVPRGSGEPVEVHVAPEVPVADVARAMAGAAKAAGVACTESVFVWGDVRGVAEARPMRVTTSGDGAVAGFVLCHAALPAFLSAQRANPRFQAGHGGSCELRWGEQQLYLRRFWAGSAEAPLGDLSADTSTVLQKGEVLAAIFDPLVVKADATANAGAVLPVLARVPRFFLFGMWPLPAV